MIYDLEHRRVALLVIDVQGEYFDSDGAGLAEIVGTAEVVERLG